MVTLSSKLVKARKSHKCSFCNCEIKKGTLYWRSVHVSSDGDLYTWKSHEVCLKMTILLGMEYEENGITEDMFYECITDNKLYDKDNTMIENVELIYKSLKEKM